MPAGAGRFGDFVARLRGRLSARRVRESPEPSSSKLVEFLRDNCDPLEEPPTEMYTWGLSARYIEDALEGATEHQLLLAKPEERSNDVLAQESDPSFGHAFGQLDINRKVEPGFICNRRD
jgi:hypothetical protein